MLSPGLIRSANESRGCRCLIDPEVQSSQRGREIEITRLLKGEHKGGGNAGLGDTVTGEEPRREAGTARGTAKK